MVIESNFTSHISRGSIQKSGWIALRDVINFGLSFILRHSTLSVISIIILSENPVPILIIILKVTQSMDYNDQNQCQVHLTKMIRKLKIFFPVPNKLLSKLDQHLFTSLVSPNQNDLLVCRLRLFLPLYPLNLSLMH